MLRGADGCIAGGNDDINVGFNQLCSMLCKLLGTQPITMRIDHEVLILDEAVSPKLFIKRDVIGRSAVANVNAANVIDPPGFLCASYKRQSRRSSNERDEFASPHVYPP